MNTISLLNRLSNSKIVTGDTDTGSDSLVLYWPFDTNMNESVNNYTATLYGTTPAISNTIYKVGTGSLNCTGSLAYVTYTNQNGILPISNTYTFSFWYYPTSNAKYYSHLFSFANSGGNDNIDLYFNLNQLTLFLVLRNGSSSVYNDQASVGNLTTNVALTINTWNHIALSITSHSSNVYITLWKNNVKTTYSRPSTNGIPQVARQFAYINGSVLSPIPPASNGDSSTTAYIDDFRVYNTLLTDEEVTALYIRTTTTIIYNPIASLSIPKSFSYNMYDYYVFSSNTSFKCDSSGTVDFIIVGGGGAGGGNHAGGGGAGGVAYGSVALVSGTTYSVTVGAGGTGGGTIETTNVYTAATNNGGNSSLTSINNTLSAPSVIQSLVAYFPLNNTVKEYVSNVTNTAATSIIYNTVNNRTGILCTSTSGYGTSGTLNATSSFVNVNIPTFSLPFTTNGVSFSVWFYPTSIGSSFQVLCNLSDSNTYGAGHLLVVKSNQMYYTFANYAGYAGSFNSPAITISNNTWYHVVFTLSSSLTPTFYLNNVAYSVNINRVNQNGSTTSLNINTTNTFAIGCANNDSYNVAGYKPPDYNSFIGTISTVGVYNAVLTSTQVNTLYNQPHSSIDLVNIIAYDLVNIIAYGGGYGGGGNNGFAYNNGTTGNTGFTILGSGGGGMAYNQPIGTSLDVRAGVGGNGVNNPLYGSTGKNGGVGFYTVTAGNGGGGGGGGAAGGNASSALGGNGGNGLSSSSLTWLPQINATGYMTGLVSSWSTATTNGTYIAGGGGGGSWAQNGWQPGTGGLGGGGTGGANGTGSGLAGLNGTNYTGGGGGGGSSTGNVGGSGGKGLVVIRVVSSTDISNSKVTSFTPTQIIGLNNWYDGSDPNGDGSIPTNGTSITSWKDKTTNANHMVAQTAGTYTSNNQNGLGTMTFSNSWYRTTIANAPYPIDAYVVVKLNSTTTVVDVLSTGSKTSDSFNSLTFSEYTTSRWHNGSSFFYRTPNAVSTSNETSTSFLLMSWSIANNNFYIYRNGVQIVSTTSYTWPKPGDNEFRIGARAHVSTANNMKGSIAEILCYNSQLPTTDRQKVEGYLAWKWGIQTSLPNTHPYYTSALYTTTTTTSTTTNNSTKKTIDTLSTAGYNALVYQGTTLQAGAFGIKLLLYSARNNPVIQIKAGTGGTPTNFYAPTDGTTNLTTGANGTGTGIVAFLNGAIGYVTIWYDQTGNGHHATATGSTLPFYDTTNGVVDFGSSGFFYLADNSFPTGNLPYTYFFKQGRVPGGNTTVWSGGTWGTFGLMELLILAPTYNDSWYAYDFYGMTPVANGLVAVTYGGSGNNTGTNGKKFYINNVLQSPPGIDTRTDPSAPRAQTSVHCYLGAIHPDGRGGYGSYNSTMPYFYWMAYQLNAADIAILGNT